MIGQEAGTTRGGLPSLKSRLFGAFAHTPQALKLVWQASRPATVAVVVITGLSALVPVQISYIGKLIVDAVVAARNTGAPSATVLEWVAIEAALVVVAAFLDRGLGLLHGWLGGRLGLHVNLLVLNKAATLGLRHFEDSQTYDRLTRARAEASSRPLSLLQQHLQLFRNGIVVLGYLALLTRFSGWMALGLLATAAPAFAAEARFSNTVFELRNRRSPERRRLGYLEWLLTVDRHYKELKLFRLRPLLIDRYRRMAHGFFREEFDLGVRRAVWTYAFSILAVAMFYSCYAFVAISAARGSISLGDMTLYLLAFRQTQQAFQAILTAIGGMYADNLYMSNLFDFLAMPVEAPRRTTAVPIVEAGIRFENVGFRYDGTDSWAVREVNLRIPAGQSIALVGENGSGKTTLVKLLTGLYEPSEGRVLLDGRPVGDWDPVVLHRRMAVVFQDFNQYQFSLHENVGIGSVERMSDIPAVKRAIERAGAGELLATLPNGVDTQLGRWFKGGVELSGGQWQKLALARAFVAEDADILVLDEPTASLDASAEFQLYEQFRTLTQGRTTIMVSHRFPTVRLADHIAVMDKGRLIEQGTHPSLVTAGGLYSRLFALQAQGYL
jgi:ATP-binding cassette subfamily B protein